MAGPAIVTKPDQEPLRVLCTEITPYSQLQARAEKDLGFPLRFEQHDFVTAQRIAATQPDRYDIYDQCFHNLDIVWFWRAIQPIRIDRVAAWDDLTDLTKKGGLSSGNQVGKGDAPVTRLFVQDDNSLSSHPSGQISMLPTVHNFDCFGINETATGVNVDRDVTSWSELLNPRWRHAVSIVDEPAIGIFDLALAAQASGDVSFADIGNMSVAEIDTLIDFCMDRCAEGHFTRFWRTTREASEMFHSGEVLIASMWSPAAVSLKSRQVRVRQAVPAEGYRAWHGGLCLAHHLSGHRLDQGYAYLNWFLSGWPGAVMARQGYYMSAIAPVQAHLDGDEWDYWYEGKPAARALPDPTGALAIRAGEQRSGGSYWRRASRIAVWNTTMAEHNYLVRRWAQLTDAAGHKTSRSKKGSPS